MLYFQVLVLAFALFNAAKACDEDCGQLTTFYESINCKEVKSDAEACCAESYDCDHLKKVGKQQCIYNGKIHEKNEEAEVEPYSLFNGCVCDGMYGFQCPAFSCPITNNPECRNTYDADKPCPTNSICPPFDKLPTCTQGNDTYYIGERFRSTKDHCQTCICQKTDDGAQAVCNKINCHSELVHQNSITRFCAPVFAKNACCPITFACPTSDIEGAVPEEEAGEKGKYCDINGQYFPLGRNFTLGVYDCECSKPPYIICRERELRNTVDLP